MKNKYQVMTLAVFTLLAGGAVDAADPLEFKGVQMGASEKELIEKIRYDICSKDECSKTAPLECKTLKTRGANDSIMGVCVVPEPTIIRNRLSIAGKTVKSAHFSLVDDRLVKISFKLFNFDFHQVTASLREKYGKPTFEKKISFTNRFGGAYDGMYYEWKIGGSFIKAHEYELASIKNRLERESEIEYVLGSHEENARQRRNQAIKDGAKDL